MKTALLSEDLCNLTKFWSIMALTLVVSISLPSFGYGQCSKNSGGLGQAGYPTSTNRGSYQQHPGYQPQLPGLPTSQFGTPDSISDQPAPIPGRVGSEPSLARQTPPASEFQPLAIPEPDISWSDKNLGISFRFPATWSESSFNQFVTESIDLSITETVSAASNNRDQQLQVAAISNARLHEASSRIMEDLLQQGVSVKRERKSRNGRIFDSLRYIQKRGGVTVNSLLLLTENQGRIVALQCSWTTDSTDLKAILDSMQFAETSAKRSAPRRETKTGIPKPSPLQTGNVSPAPQQASPSPASPASSENVAKTASSNAPNLESIIKKAGFQLKSKTAKGTYTFEVASSKTRAYRFRANFDPEKKDLILIASLATVPTDMLGGLQAANELAELSIRNTKARFHFQESSGEIHLAHLTKEIETVDHKQFATLVTHLVQVINRTEFHWNPRHWHIPRHLGMWRAELPQGKFDLNLQPGDKFSLIETSDDERIELSGTYSIDQKRLELTDESGFTFDGEIHFIDGNRFELAINNKTLTFIRL